MRTTYTLTIVLLLPGDRGAHVVEPCVGKPGVEHRKAGVCTFWSPDIFTSTFQLAVDVCHYIFYRLHVSNRYPLTIVHA